MKDIGSFIPKYQDIIKTDKVKINPYFNEDIVKRAAQHETLHSAYNSAGDLMPIEVYKLNRIIKPRSEVNKIGDKFKMNNEDLNNYLGDYLSEHEILTNVRDVANTLGIKPGDKYPGYEKFKNMLEYYTGEKPFVVESLNLTNKPSYKKVFDIMNRSSLGIIPAGMLLNNKYK